MKTVIEMAREAGFQEPNPHDGYMGLAFDYRKGTDTGASLELFAELVRADEREACVQDIQMHIPRSGRDTTEYQRAMRMIERIQARGNK